MALFPPARMGGSKVEHGYKGKGSTFHLISDANGKPLLATVTSAIGDERLELPKLLDKIPMKGMSIVEADKGYDSRKVRLEILKRGHYPLIPYRRKRHTTHDWVKKVRWKVERSISWLKRAYRRVATRWERLAEIYEGFVLLAICMYWVKQLVG